MQSLSIFLKGIVVGVANIIPGVSGGTMALVLGIYERLIAAIHAISPSTAAGALGLFRFNRNGLDRFREEMKKIDALFLVKLVSGAVAAIVILAKIMTFLLVQWHDPTYGFFFGLVLVSVYAPYRLIKKKSLPVIIPALLAMAAVLTLSSVTGDAMLEKAKAKHTIQMSAPSSQDVSAEKPLSPATGMYFLFAGAVSISAMILPGISGSFVLLLMGGYFDMLKAIAERDWPIIIIFSLGCLIGIILFTRLLNYLLKNWHDYTMSFLVGLVLGSLWMIWPFKTWVMVGSEKVYMNNFLPNAAGSNEIITLLTFIAGAVIVAIFFRIEKPAE